MIVVKSLVMEIHVLILNLKMVGLLEEWTDWLLLRSVVEVLPVVLLTLLESEVTMRVSPSLCEVVL